MLLLVVLLILLVLVFGSLGIFVAKVFLFALAAVLLLGALTEGYVLRRRS